MARTSATISVGADTRQLEKDIQSALSRDFKFKGFNDKAFTQPLGRITGASNEFQKSLDASNARVIAFGASAGSIFAVEKAFVNLIKSTIDVQKSLTDINIILTTTSKGLEKFGADLFTVAKDTGQSFQSVAEAATELARQGLGVEETLKRTRDALILTRLSGLDTVSSVEALTATLNSFNKTALDSTTIINKLANVDAAFAVSSADLASAVQRVGSSAQDAGVGFDELLAIVTSVQQTTSRGGAVIGNSLKTIFTRIARPEVLDQLQNLGLEVRNLDGGTRPAIDILKELSSTFDTLSDSQKSQIAETVGGVFQINILKAALGDLGKEYSVYNNALNTSRGATDQAIKRNEALNETLSAIASRTLTNFTQLGSKVGSGAFQPAIESTLKNVNSLLEGLANQDTESIGAKIGSGILGGLSTFISGPGLLLVTAVVGKLFLDLTKFAGSSAKTLLGIGKQATDRAAIEGKISSILAQEPQLLSAIASKQITVLDVENRILGILREQNAVRAQAATLSGSITSGLVGRGVGLKGGQITAKSDGFIPNFVMQEIYGALAGGYKPGNIKEMNIPGVGKTIYNSAETVKRMPGFSQPAIMPPEGSKAGKNYKQSFSDKHGFNPYASAGLIPNFAKTFYNIKDENGKLTPYNNYQIPGLIANGKISEKAARDANWKPEKELSTEKKSAKQKEYDTGFYNTQGRLGVVSVSAGSPSATASTKVGALKVFNSAVEKNPELATKKITFSNIQVRSLEGNLEKRPSQFTNLVNEALLDPIASLTHKYLGTVLRDESASPAALNDVRSALKGKKLIPSTAEGSIFEAAVALATKTPTQFIRSIDDEDNRPFDFEEAGPATSNFKKRFKFAEQLEKADAKLTGSPGAIASIIKKAYNSNFDSNLPYSEYLSGGFVPNFANALNDAINREKKAGVNPNSIKVGKSNSLISNMNPSGLGVYNTKDEPRGLSQGISRYGSLNNARKAGAAKGLIPNFALYSKTQTEAGSVTMPASKEANRAFADLARSVYNGKKTFDQANIELAQLAKQFDLIDSSTGKVRNTLTRADASYKKLVVQTDTLVAASSNLITGSEAVKQLEAKAAAGGRGGELARGGLETARERRSNASSRLQGIGIGASIAVPIVSQIAQEFMPNNKYARAGTTVLGDTAAFAGTGALFGPWGAAIGGLIGVTIGLTKAFKELNDRSEEFAKNSRDSGNKVARFSEDVQGFLTSREKIAGVEAGAIKATPNDLNKLQDQRSASFNRILSSVSEDIQKELLAGLSGTEEQLQSAIQRANDEIASNNFVNQFIQNTNEQLKDGAKNLDLTDTLRQLGSIKTTNGEYIGDLISQQSGLLKSFDTLTIASEKYYGINDQVAKSIEQASIAADKATMSIDEFAKNDIFGFNTTNVGGAGAAPAGFGSQNVQQIVDDLGNVTVINPTREAYEKDLQTAIQDSGKGLKDFILQLGDSGKLQKDKALELANSIQAILDSNKSLEEKGKALQETFGNLRKSSEIVDQTFKKLADAQLNYVNLTSQTMKLFSQDPAKRQGAADFIEQGDFGNVLKEFLKDEGKQFLPENVFRNTNTAAMQGILGGTADSGKRTELERKFGETYKKAAQEIAATGVLTDRTLADLQIAIQQTSIEASMTTKNLVELGSSIGDAATRTEVLNIYTAKESQLKKELGDNIIKLTLASSAAADSLRAIAGFKEGTLFADEYKQLQDKARQDKIRSGQGSVTDIFGSFGDEMTYGTQDAFRDLNNIASDTARTMKSQFNEAFQSIIDGTQNVGDAFQSMALNISRRIQQLSLEMTTNAITNSLFSSIGGLPSIFKNPLGAAGGGYVSGNRIQKFSNGGKVLGGSGTKDDVPAMLSNGEYVIKKSSVRKYGENFLHSLNNEGSIGMASGGGVDEYTGGGGGRAFDLSESKTTKNISQQLDIPAVDETKLSNQEQIIAQMLRDSNKQGDGRVIDLDTKNKLESALNAIQEYKDINITSAYSSLVNTIGGFRAELAGSYKYNDSSFPSAGEYVLDPLLSSYAILNENDPQNRNAMEKRQALISYLAEGLDLYDSNKKAIFDTIDANNRERARVDQLNKQNRDNFNKQQQNTLIGGALSAAGSLGAGAFNTYGAPAIRNASYDLFGSKQVKRAIPTNQTKAGDFDPYKYATYVKDGGFMGFAKGGSSGKDDIPAMLMGGEYVMRKDAVNTYGKNFFEKLNNGRIRKFADGGYVSNGSENLDQNSGPKIDPSTNNISISVNVGNNGSTDSSMKANDDTSSPDSATQAKELSNKIRNEVVRVITEQQRPGGLLRK
jgi:TP901 family phage tail tape measure protein